MSKRALIWACLLWLSVSELFAVAASGVGGASPADGTVKCGF